MKYAIKNYGNSIETSREVYENVVKARINLLEVLNIEEKMNLLLENYSEYEKQLLDYALDFALFFDLQWSSAMNRLHTINRRVSNLLSMCRLYLDHTSHSISTIYGKKSAEYNGLEKKKKDQYDTYLGYRVMEALRNYVQHRSLPINHLERKTERTDLNVSKFVIVPNINLNQLKEDKGFKSSVLKELEVIGEKIDIRIMIRQYIESIGRIHNFIRDTMKDDIQNWDNIYMAIQKKYVESFDDNLIGLAVIKYDEVSEKIISKVNVYHEIIKRRKWLKNKNRYLERTSFQVITNESLDAYNYLE